MHLSANEIKRIRSLAQKKFRDELGLFVVEGEKSVSEALASGFEVAEIYRKDEIGEAAMERISQLSSPSPVLALVRKPADSVIAGENLQYVIGKTGLYLGLDSIRDPGNLGTIIRLADWFGLDGVLAARDSVDIFNPKVVQATMGAVFRVRFHYTDLEDAVRYITGNGGCVYGTFMDGKNIYGTHLETGSDSPVMIVIGNEADGISDKIADSVSQRIAIPPYPAGHRGPESLNAAVAAAITVAEFRRRSL